MNPRFDHPVDTVRALEDLPGVRAEVAAARDACTQLRWHQALRRRIPEAAAESRVRGARASAWLDGADVPLDVVRDLMRGAQAWPHDPDPVLRTVRGAVQATAEAEHQQDVVRRSPSQTLARLHTAAATPLADAATVGRPRTADEDCAEMTELGPAASSVELRSRLASLVELARLEQASALVVAALAHAEIATARPFVAGNALVARALERCLVMQSGLDPTGVVVPEMGYAAGGLTAYVGALSAYSSGTAEGVGLWLQHAARALQRGAVEGQEIADAVLAGRLS